jgi:glycosyltransferase involved in cell wall biosynthesis
LKTENKINILYLIASLFPGGAEKLLLSTLKYLDKKKFSPFVCCTKQEGSLAPIVREMGIPIYSINMKSLMDVKALKRISKIIRTNNIDIIHSNFVDIDIAARILSFLLRVKCASTFHSALEGKEYETYRWKIKFFLSRITANLLPVELIADSDFVRSIYIDKHKFSQKKFTTIHNFCDEKSMEIKGDFDPLKKRGEVGLNADDIVFINIARLVEEKYQEKLIENIAQAQKTNDKIKLLIVGSGSLEPHLKTMILDNNLNDVIKMLGYREDIAELLSLSDVFILSSKKEGLPIALLEAMLLAKPVIATNVGAISEAIINRKSGILIEISRIEELSEIILESAENISTMRKLALEAQKHYFEKFNSDRYMSKLEELYLRMMER